MRLKPTSWKFGKLTPHAVEIAMLSKGTGIRQVAAYMTDKIGQPIHHNSVFRILKHIQAERIQVTPQMMLDAAESHPEGKTLLPILLAHAHQVAKAEKQPEPTTTTFPTEQPTEQPTEATPISTISKLPFHDPTKSSIPPRKPPTGAGTISTPSRHPNAPSEEEVALRLSLVAQARKELGDTDED